MRVFSFSNPISISIDERRTRITERLRPPHRRPFTLGSTTASNAVEDHTILTEKSKLCAVSFGNRSFNELHQNVEEPFDLAFRLRGPTNVREDGRRSEGAPPDDATVGRLHNQRQDWSHGVCGS